MAHWRRDVHGRCGVSFKGVFMRTAGQLLVILGALLALFGLLLYDPTVPSSAVGDFIPAGRTVNLQLLAGQLGVILAGGFMFVAGAVFYAGAAIAAAVRDG